MSVKVFIDGSSGTTGLRIADRLAARPDIELLSISAEGRKDVNERAKVINSADLAFLCLPDAASKEVMPLLRPDVRVLDTSTAFRTDAAWDYGFPELKGQKEKIKNSYRVAVPGCYASGFISIARPLVELGLAPADYPFSCTGISGYSGGGKKMIAEYESADRPAHSKLDAPKSYGLGLAHKHLPEMQKISGLAHTPAFVPVVCDYYSGMQVLVPLDLKLAGTSAEAVAAGIADYYKEGATVSVHALNEPLPENGLFLIEKPDGEVVEFSNDQLKNDEYRQYLGSGLPKVYLGWTNNLSYKNWDLSMQFTSQLGFKILNEPRAFYENNSIAYNRLKSVEEAPYGGQYTLSSSQPQTFVSYYLEDGDFLKLTNLTIGYTFPIKKNNKYIKGVRAYLSGDNLFCITGYSGLDPELSNWYPTSAGIDARDKYPSIRSFTFGLNLTF